MVDTFTVQAERKVVPSTVSKLPPATRWSPRSTGARRRESAAGGGVVAGVEGEAGVRAAVRRPRPAAGALLDGVAGVGIVQPHHDPTRRVAGDPVQPEVAVGVVDEGDHTAEGLDALLDEHVTGD